MKTLIDIDEKLLENAMTLSRTETKKETVQRALEEFVKLHLRGRLKQMAGSGALEWSRDGLQASRRKRGKTQTRLRKAGA